MENWPCIGAKPTHVCDAAGAAAGADLFISVWNLHHSPYLWKDPEAFRPERFEEVFTNDDFGGKWAGETQGGWAAYSAFNQIAFVDCSQSTL
jgi:cytochrome P450